MLAPMLASVHNLHFYVTLMRDDVRGALEAGTFAVFASAFRARSLARRLTRPRDLRRRRPRPSASVPSRRTRLTEAGECGDSAPGPRRLSRRVATA
jgi:hypothetical protein